jgi:hypothetical protein
LPPLPLSPLRHCRRFTPITPYFAIDSLFRRCFDFRHATYADATLPAATILMPFSLFSMLMPAFAMPAFAMPQPFSAAIIAAIFHFAAADCHYLRHYYAADITLMPPISFAAICFDFAFAFFAIDAADADADDAAADDRRH